MVSVGGGGTLKDDTVLVQHVTREVEDDRSVYLMMRDRSGFGKEWVESPGGPSDLFTSAKVLYLYCTQRVPRSGDG